VEDARMKKLFLDELEIESFVTTPDPEARLGTVRGHDDGFTEAGTCTCFTKGDSCNYSDCGTCELSCAQSCDYSCPGTCNVTCGVE
jgi:hypothetical protein